MKNLVLNQTNVGVITLKDVTDLISVEHNKAMKVVDRLCLEPSFGEVEKFTTLNLNNVKVNTYLLTKKQAIAVGAKLNNKLLMKVIDRLEELEVRKPLTVNEQIALIAQGYQDVNNQIMQIKTEIKETVSEMKNQIENDITLTSAQKYHLKDKVNQKAYELKNKHHFADDFMNKVYPRIWKKLKKHFVVSSYMEIPKSKFDEACAIVESVTFGDLM